jgi:hypothetical protein
MSEDQNLRALLTWQWILEVSQNLSLPRHSTQMYMLALEKLDAAPQIVALCPATGFGQYDDLHKRAAWLSELLRPNEK